MGMFYKVPIRGVTWGAPEFRAIARATFVGPPKDAIPELAAYLEQQYGGRAIPVNSGRSAVELALRRLRRQTNQPHPSVLTPSLICRAVPDKIVAADLTPVFYDISPNLSPSVESLRHAIRPDTIAVVFPYLYGKVVPVEGVATFCKQAGIALIEDCAASFLLPYPTGSLSGAHGDYVIFSFQRGKTTVAGGGGALVDRTATPHSYEVANWAPGELRKLHLSKMTFMLEEVFLRTGYLLQRTVGLPQDFFRSTMEQVREISPLDCGLVLTQMEKWPAIVAGRERVLRRYASNLAGNPHLHLPQCLDGGFATRVFVKFSGAISDRPRPHEWTSAVADYMRGKGIEVHMPYFPVHRMSGFAQYSGSELPVTDEFYQSLLEIPAQPSLQDDEIDYVCECLIQAAATSLETPPAVLSRLATHQSDESA